MRSGFRTILGVILLAGGWRATGSLEAGIAVTEREALVALYNSTNGASWTDNSGSYTAQQDMVGGNVVRYRAAAGAGPMEFDQKTVNLGAASTDSTAVVAANITGNGDSHVVVDGDGGELVGGTRGR